MIKSFHKQYIIDINLIISPFPKSSIIRSKPPVAFDLILCFPQFQNFFFSFSSFPQLLYSMVSLYVSSVAVFHRFVLGAHFGKSPETRVLKCNVFVMLF